MKGGTMNKPLYQSKTLWGFGLAGLIAIAQLFGVTYSETIVAEVLKVLTGLFGVYGVRRAIN